MTSSNITDRNTTTDNEEISGFIRKRRYNSDNHDLFLRAWMMIKATCSSGIPFFGKSRLKKEFGEYLCTLCIRDFPYDSPEALSLREEEWTSFAKDFLSGCTGSKGYCSTLFGLMPIKDDAVTKKIAEEIVLVTKTYPSALDLAEEMKPFSDIMIRIFCDSFENGESYIEAAMR